MPCGRLDVNIFDRKNGKPFVINPIAYFLIGDFYKLVIKNTFRLFAERKRNHGDDISMSALGIYHQGTMG